MEWKVFYYDCNWKKIRLFNVFNHPRFYEEVKAEKKAAKCKEDFLRDLKVSVHYYFWSKVEWELTIKKDEDGRVFLEPFSFGLKSKRNVIEVTHSDMMDWKSFAEYHIGKQIFGNEAKIDVCDQIMFQWDVFSEMVWNSLESEPQ